MYLLRLVAQTLLVAIFAHALAALVLRDFSLSLLFERTHELLMKNYEI